MPLTRRYASVRNGLASGGSVAVGCGKSKTFSDPASPPDVIVGSELSRAARTAASEAGIGWLDETGAAEIVIGDIVVSRSGEPRRDAVVTRRWTPSVVGVAESILCGVTPTVLATAEATGHSTSSVAHALATLSELGLLESPVPRGRNSGRRVTDLDRLLDEYALAAVRLRPKMELRCGVLWREPFVLLEQIGKRWDHADIGWAVTGVMGAAVLAPYLTETTTGDVYVDAASLPESSTTSPAWWTSNRWTAAGWSSGRSRPRPPSGWRPRQTASELHRGRASMPTFARSVLGVRKPRNT